MPALQTFQVRTFGPASSTIALAKYGGATLGGIWISAKGTAPTIAVYDQASATPNGAKKAIASTVLTAIGIQNTKEIEMGTGLVITVASCTGSILWRPGPAGGV